MSKSKYDNRDTYLLVSISHCTSPIEEELLDLLISPSLQGFIHFPISIEENIKFLFSQHQITFNLENVTPSKEYRLFLFRSSFYLLKALYRNIYYSFLGEEIKFNYYFLSEEENENNSVEY